jgi:DNA-binding Xre family transcriptional regulator
MIWETSEAKEWIDKEKELYFYSNLEALMAEKGLSIAELSERTGVAQSTIRSLIRGRLKRLDSISTGKLTQFFQCKLDELYAVTNPALKGTGLA